MDSLKLKLEGQLHLLDYWNELDVEQQGALVKQIGMFDIPALNSTLIKSLNTKPPNANEISRIDSDRIIDRQLLSSDELDRLETLGGWRSKQLLLLCGLYLISSAWNI